MHQSFNKARALLQYGGGGGISNLSRRRSLMKVHACGKRASVFTASVGVYRRVVLGEQYELGSPGSQ